MVIEKRCGHIAVVGRPNAGKSTLLNAIMERKLVSTSRKAQTTRHNILGIKTQKNTQAIYVDTPGYRDVTPGALHRYLNRSAVHAAYDVDLLLWVVDATRFTRDDEAVLALIKKVDRPTILVLNKIDEIKAKYDLLPIIQKMQGMHNFLEIVPISALSNINVSDLEKTAEKYLPVQEFFYAENQLTDRTEAFLYAEMIREKIMRFLGEEVPYSVAVEIEQIVHEENLIRVAGLLWVERDGQKAIVIGDKGETLKRIGMEARLDMEKFAKKKVFLQLWVKVKEGWTENDEMIQSFGYES
ncbi:MAG: GTPase Era [Gammaproteobacteria bacterium]|nr:GTPase Era [Gammaproteobacteria bacterium]